ncbi:MAG: alpha/beta fold hydrolase [Phycisphaerales bacterium]
MLRSAIVTVVFAALSSVALAQPAPVSRSVVSHGATIRSTDLPAAADAPALEPLVFVHGWGGSRGLFREAMAAFGGERRTLAIDLPGHGESEDVDESHTMDLYAEVIAAAMDEAGIERAVLIGHSNGVAAVRQFERRYGARCAAMVAVDGSLTNQISREQMGMVLQQLGSNEAAQVVDAFASAMTQRMRDEDEARQVRDTMVFTPPAVLAKSLRAMAEDAIWTPDPITPPLLLVLAQQPTWDEAYFEAVRAMAPKAVVRIWPGASHFLFMDDPSRFARVIRAFLDDEGL